MHRQNEVLQQKASDMVALSTIARSLVERYDDDYFDEDGAHVLPTFVVRARLLRRPLVLGAGAQWCSTRQMSCL